MKFSSKNVMKMLKEPKMLVVLVLVLIVLVVGVVYLLKMRREGFQVDPCYNCDADVLSNEKAVECAAAGCFEDDTEGTSTSTPTSTTTSDPCEGCDADPISQDKREQCDINNC